MEEKPQMKKITIAIAILLGVFVYTHASQTNIVIPPGNELKQVQVSFSDIELPIHPMGYPYPQTGLFIQEGKVFFYQLDKNPTMITVFDYKNNQVQGLAPYGKGNGKGEMKNVPFAISFNGSDVFLVAWEKTYPLKTKNGKLFPGQETSYLYKNMLYARSLYGKRIVAQVYYGEEGPRGSYYLEVFKFKGLKKGNPKSYRLNIQGYLIDHQVRTPTRDEDGKILKDKEGKKIWKKKTCHTRTRAPLEVVDKKIFASVDPNDPKIRVMNRKLETLYTISLQHYKTRLIDTERVREYNKKDQYPYCHGLYRIPKGKLLIVTNRRIGDKALAVVMDTKKKAFQKVLLPLVENIPGGYWPLGRGDNVLMHLYRTGEKGKERGFLRKILF